MSIAESDKKYADSRRTDILPGHAPVITWTPLLMVPYSHDLWTPYFRWVGRVGGYWQIAGNGVRRADNAGSKVAADLLTLDAVDAEKSSLSLLCTLYTGTMSSIFRQSMPWTTPWPC